MTTPSTSNPPSLGLLATTFLLLLFVGCGAAPTPSTPAPVYPDISGNWQFELKFTSPPVIPDTPILQLFGSLASSGSKVTGTLNAQPGSFPTCTPNNADFAVTGTVDTAGNITLTAPIAGGSATLTSTTAIPRSPLANGTYQVVGGACPQALIGLLGIEFPSVSGTYSGTLTQLFPAGTGSLTVKAVLLESTTPNADGEYPLTGTITYTGDCAGTLSFSNGIVFGDQLQSAPLSADFSTNTELFSGGIPLVGLQPLPANFFLPAGCSVTAYNGTLTRQ
jgi:hypothetical protein